MSQFYTALAVAPIVGAPVQLLYLKSGKRYDVGAVFFIATGGFLGALLGRGSPQQIDLATRVLFFLLPFSLIMFVLRIVALTFFEPMIFTLISLAQMWSFQPLITYALSQKNEFSVYVGQLLPGSIVLGLGLFLNVACAVLLARFRIPSRLRAASDSPVDYSILMGSRFRLSVCIETIAIVCYLLAGIAFRMVHANLSPEDFNGEGIWMLLSVAVLPKFDWRLTILGPLVVVVLRYAVASLLSADFSAIVAYIVLALVLAVSALYEVKSHRVQRA